MEISVQEPEAVAGDAHQVHQAEGKYFSAKFEVPGGHLCNCASNFRHVLTLMF